MSQRVRRTLGSVVALLLVALVVVLVTRIVWVRVREPPSEFDLSVRLPAGRAVVLDQSLEPVPNAVEAEPGGFIVFADDELQVAFLLQSALRDPLETVGRALDSTAPTTLAQLTHVARGGKESHDGEDAATWRFRHTDAYDAREYAEIERRMLATMRKHDSILRALGD